LRSCVRPRGVVQRVPPVGRRWVVKPPWVLAWWWCVHLLSMLSTVLRPVGQGMRWSFSLSRARRVQPGKVQVRSHNNQL
jgi:hypothetical protein